MERVELAVEDLLGLAGRDPGVADQAHGRGSRRGARHDKRSRPVTSRTKNPAALSRSGRPVHGPDRRLPRGSRQGSVCRGRRPGRDAAAGAGFMPRMIILHAAERQAYEAPPILDAAQRSRAFDVPAGLLDMAEALRKPAHRIGFLVSCAYFGTAKRFFAPEGYHARDIRHAAHRLELPATFAAADYPARTRQRHERLILQSHGYRRFDDRAEDF